MTHRYWMLRLLKRLGRFDRVVAFRPPNRELCADYLYRLSRGRLNVQELRGAVLEADGLSFAQLRESYIIAGKLAFDSERPVSVEHLHGKESTLFGLRVPE